MKLYCSLCSRCVFSDYTCRLLCETVIAFLKSQAGFFLLWAMEVVKDWCGLTDVKGWEPVRSGQAV